jgi:hypothetical protein
VTAQLEISEAEWSGLIVATAKFQGWSVYHTLNSKGSTPGFPDLVMVRPPELLIVELKTERGQVTKAQQEWLDLFAGCDVEIACWRPSQWADVEVRLRKVRDRG